MTNTAVENQVEITGLEFISAELDYVKLLVAKSSLELEHGHLNEAHEAVLIARRTCETLTRLVAALSSESVDERRYLIVRLGLADRSMTRSERRLAAHVRVDEFGGSAGNLRPAPGP